MWKLLREARFLHSSRHYVRSLEKWQKESLGLLGLGTFLEYFDLYLFVHMGAILEREFFPQSDPRVASLLGALTFCVAFIFRPFGALIFGWIGDYVGRRQTVMITTLISGLVCLVMATLTRTGMTAVWIICSCRVLQGMASMGEIIGARIYLTETIKPPMRYIAVASLNLGGELGGLFALLVTTIVLHTSLDWRTGFWIGAAVAAVGSVARSRLREAPEFLEAKEARLLTKRQGAGDRKDSFPSVFIPWKTCFAYLGLQSPVPFGFFLIFLYWGPQLRGLGYTAEDVVTHNLLVSCIGGIGPTVLGLWLCKLIWPLKIIKIRGIIRCVICGTWLLFFPYLHNAQAIFLLQIALCFFCMNTFPADAVLIKIFPIGVRFRSMSLMFSLAGAVMHVISAFGVIYLTDIFGPRGILIVLIPLSACFFWGLSHFEKEEDKIWAAKEKLEEKKLEEIRKYLNKDPKLFPGNT